MQLRQDYGRVASLCELQWGSKNQLLEMWESWSLWLKQCNHDQQSAPSAAHPGAQGPAAREVIVAGSTAEAMHLSFEWRGMHSATHQGAQDAVTREVVVLGSAIGAK